MRSVKGFTLIELMVVISIIAILTLITLVNFKSFSQDQQLKKAVGEVQTYLRLAQSNATSSVKCNGSGGAKWVVKFRDSSNIDLLCGDVTTPIQTLTLQNITDSIEGSCVLIFPVYITYSVLTGIPTFTDNSGNNICLGTNQNLKIKLTNSIGTVKDFTLTTGGAIDAQ